MQPDAPLIPRSVLFGNPERLDPRVSPDGGRLAWIAPHDGVLNVWVAPRDAIADATAVTEDTERGIRSFAWAHDGRTLLYVQDRGGDENWRLYGVDLVAGGTRDLTPFEGVQAQIIDLDRRHPDRVLVALNRDNPERHDAYSLDLATGALELVAANEGFVGWVADADFVPRAAVAPQPDGGTVVMVRDGAAAPWRPLLAAAPEDALTTEPVAFSADGSTLLAISSVGRDTGALVRLDAATGEVVEVIAADPAADVTAIELHPYTKEPQVVTFTRERRDLVVVDPSIADDVAAIRSLHPGDLALNSRDDADRWWVVAFTADDGPVSYHLWDREARQGRLLFTHQPALAEHRLAAMRPFSLEARDGLALHGYLTAPVGAEGPTPAVLLVHGGPWARDTWGYHAEAQWLANRGYLCIQVNYRGSTGYGKAFLSAGDREWGARMHDDLVDTVDWVVARGLADPDRVAIMGGSYGGYAALAGAAFTPGQFAAAIDIVGPSNLVTLVRSIPPYWAPLIAQFHTRVGNPETHEEFLRSRSPLFRADRITIPLLIAQGANDPRVPQAESEQIVEALRAHGVDHEYMLFPDEGHGFAKPANRLRFYAAAEAFLARHIGGRAEP